MTSIDMAPIRIEGLDELRRGLRRMDAGATRALRVALNDAAQLVVDDARPKVPRLTGRAAASLRVASTQSSVRVRGGGARVPYYPWLDFGGSVGRGKGSKRAFFKAGRYLWHSFAELSGSGEIQRVLDRSLHELGRQSGIEVT